MSGKRNLFEELNIEKKNRIFQDRLMSMFRR